MMRLLIKSAVVGCALYSGLLVLLFTGCAKKHMQTVLEVESIEWTSGSSTPLIGMHYMPWYNNPHTSSRSISEWSHWEWTGQYVQHQPDRQDERGKRDIASVQYPLIGAYSSDNKEVVRYHMQTAKAAGIDVVFVIWYGPGSDTDELIPLLLNEAHSAGLKLAICYEEKLNWPPYRMPKSRSDIVSTTTEDLNYILENYVVHPAYLKRDNIPFIFQFNYWGEDDLGKRNLLPREWEEVFSSIKEPVVYARQNLNPEYHPDIAGAYVWWTPDESYLNDFSEYSRQLVDDKEMGFFMTMAAHGFDDSGVNGWGNGPRIHTQDSIETLDKTFEIAAKGNPEVIQLVTWNDFNEGTALEPTLENGFLYLDRVEQNIGKITGRPVDLQDNRIPFEEYMASASSSQLEEVPAGALDIVHR